MHPTDGNTYAINRHLAEIEEYEARQRAKWPLCEICGEPSDPDYMNSEGQCDDCCQPSPEEMERIRRQYEAEKAAGLLRPQHEIDEELRRAGRGRQVK